MTVFHTTPLQRLSQAELRLPFALMRPGNLSFSWKSYAEQVGFHRPSDHCVNPCIIKRLPQSLLLCSMSCYKHWYACPETTALQLTTASILSFCYFYLTTLILFMNTIHLKRLPQSLLLCSMSCYKHWYACPETTALQLTTASILSFCYFYLTTLILFMNTIHLTTNRYIKISKYCRMALPPGTKSPKALHKYNF